MTKQEQKARELIAGRTTEQLLNDWEATTNNNDEHIPTVRGWIMDELAKREPEAFDAWIESEEAADEELRNYINH